MTRLKNRPKTGNQQPRTPTGTHDRIFRETEVATEGKSTDA